MNRLKGHALRHKTDDENPSKFEWACECGQPFGTLPVHQARKAWRDHKAQLPEEAS